MEHKRDLANRQPTSILFFVILFIAFLSYIKPSYGILSSFLWVLCFFTKRWYRAIFVVVLCLGISFIQSISMYRYIDYHSGHNDVYRPDTVTVVMSYDSGKAGLLRCRLATGCDAFIRLDSGSYELVPGDVIRIENLRLQKNYVIPVEPFSFDMYKLSRGFCFRGYVTRFQSVKKVGGVYDPEIILNRLRYDIKEFYIFVLNRPAAAFINALVIGIRYDMDRNLYNQFKMLSVSHLIVVSGFQIVVLYYLLYYPLTFLITNYKSKNLSIILLLLCYTALCDFDAPVLRAFLMFSVAIIANIMSVRLRKYEILIISFIVILWLNPFEFYNIGFYMSFLCVCGLLYCLPAIRGLIPFTSGSHVFRYVLASVYVTVSATIPLFPVIALSFGKFSPLFVLTNILIGLPTSVCFFLGLAMLALGDSLYVWFIKVSIEHIYGFIEYVVVGLSSLPNSNVEISTPSPLSVIIYYLGLYLALMLYSFGKKVYAAVLLVMLPLILLS